jgi:phytanoyl-CoA hydroxylase
MMHVKTDENVSRRKGDRYFVSDSDRAKFRELGFVTLERVLTEEEVREIETVYDKFIRGEISGMRRDLCDMSASYDTPFEKFSLINAMLPREYYPALKGNLFERISADISRQLIGDGIGLDYDQFLSKKPGCPAAAFSMHQDMGYWPAQTPDTRTATVSLAVTDATAENGCIEFLPGSHIPPRLWPHKPKFKSTEASEGEDSSRDKGHTLVLDMDENAETVLQPVKRGDVTVHDEWVVHGSGGNPSTRWRKTYVIAYRSLETIAYERSLGFTHSHNDVVQWKTLLDLS